MEKRAVLIFAIVIMFLSVLLVLLMYNIPDLNAGEFTGSIEYNGWKPAGFPWGIAYNAAVVHAMRPDATVDSVVETALNYSFPSIRREIQRALDIASKYSDPLDMRREFYTIYSGRGIKYYASYANETAAKAIAVFAATKGNVKDSIIVSVNFGRDTDCLAASAAGLAGAFSGTTDIPPEWIERVDYVTMNENPYTNTHMTMKEMAEGIYSALQNKVRKMKDYVNLMES